MTDGEREHADALLRHGLRLIRGDGVEQDHVAAAVWFRMAADLGDARAQLLLGACHADGQGVEQDDAEAARWYRKAAELGHAEAQYVLGVGIYGKSVAARHGRYVRWY